MSRPIIVRRSPIHGNGVFAARDLPRGASLIRYRGRLLRHDEADDHYGHTVDSGHTFLFTLNDQIAEGTSDTTLANNVRALGALERDEDQATQQRGILYSALGARTATVNSFHHQAIDRLGEGLRATATAPDGVIEAIELDGYPALGLQCELQEEYRINGRFAAVFDWFVAAAQARAAQLRGRRLSVS